MFKEREKLDEKWFISPDLCIKDSTIPHAGTGVFARIDIPARTIIESSPVILCASYTFTELNNIHPGVRHILSDYPFQWPDGRSAFCLGWGGCINHSFEPNVQWRFRTEKEHGFNALIFRTKRNIKAGEEIFVRYVWNADNLWFIDDTVESPRHMGGTLRQQIKQQGSMGMQAQGFWNDVRKFQDVRGRGHKPETLGDFKLLPAKKTEDD